MSEYKEILVTGGAGYIGSHVIAKLLQAGFTPVVIDNFCNSDLSNLKALEEQYSIPLPLYHGDVTDIHFLNHVFAQHHFDSVMHFAALKDVNQSKLMPHSYYKANVEGTLRLLEAMDKADINRLIFSSSASIYGVPDNNPVDETAPFKLATSPYGATKQAVEAILASHCALHQNWSCAALRYFNPVGADAELGLHEKSINTPTNLFPIIIQSIQCQRPVKVYGTDFATADGSGVRDFIHIDDLANGHIAALNYMNTSTGYKTWNLGTGQGHSVLEVIQAFERYLGKAIAYVASDPRAGDVPECWAATNKAREQLNWVANKNLEDMVASAWTSKCSN